MRQLALALIALLGLAATASAAEEARRLRLAVVPIEFPDAARDGRYSIRDLDELLLSHGTYRRTPDGETAFGSVADWYGENSSGRLRVEGKVFDRVRARSARKTLERADWLGKGLGFALLLPQALYALEAREGEAALDGFDAVAFIAAGGQGPHGTVLWPHSAALPWRGRLLKYYLMNEKQGGRFAAIGVHCHELGHVLGIFDKYGARDGKRRGHAGLGIWCAMAIGHRGDREHRDRRPLHLCAWCKERLGWLDPKIVDPRERRTIRLRGVEGRPGEALKVLIDPAGGEYFLIENRRRTGFDAGIPRPGLLIWHVGEIGQRLRNRVPAYALDLEEAHGDETRAGPFRDLARVPWPLEGRTAFTPWTAPGSTSWNLSALPVAITGIHEDGEDIVLTIDPDAARSTRPLPPPAARAAERPRGARLLVPAPVRPGPPRPEGRRPEAF